jgi:Intracellular proteinase inhibitor
VKRPPFAVPLTVFALVLGCASALAAADVPYTLLLNARGMLPSATPDALERDGVVYIDVARATRIFDGLVTYSGDSVRLSIQHSVGDFRVGRPVARLSGVTVKLPGPPFREYRTVYVPISTVVVRLAGARLQLDPETHVAQILVATRRLTSSPPSPRASPSPLASPSPQVSLSDDGGSLRPSLGQALVLTPSGSVDSAGLHVRVDIANKTASPVVATFASSAQVAFLVLRNGTEVWDSTAGQMYAQAETTLNFEPHSVRSFSGLWTGFASAGAGRYELRAKLLTDSPLLSSPVSLGVFPAPTST